MDRFRQILRALLVVERLPPPPEKAPRVPRRREAIKRVIALERLPPPPEPTARKARPRPAGLGIFQALFAIEKLPPYEAPPPAAKPARSAKAEALFQWIEDLPVDPPRPRRRRLPLLKWLFWPERLGDEEPGNDEAR